MNCLRLRNSEVRFLYPMNDVYLRISVQSRLVCPASFLLVRQRRVQHLFDPFMLRNVIQQYYGLGHYLLVFGKPLQVVLVAVETPNDVNW